MFGRAAASQGNSLPGLPAARQQSASAPWDKGRQTVSYDSLLQFSCGRRPWAHWIEKQKRNLSILSFFERSNKKHDGHCIIEDESYGQTEGEIERVDLIPEILIW